MISRKSSYLQLLVLTTSAQQCKTYPGEAAWPNATTWQALNETVSGRLTAPLALGAVCHRQTGSFNNDSCNTLSTQWSNTSFVASNPWLADYNDESCSPASSDSPCTTAGYPAYIISAAEVADVQAGLDFARTHNIRLVVKGTGHDFPGRSPGAGSLSIYTHNLRGMEVNMSDQTAMRYGGIAAVKIAAGMRFREIYTEAAKHNITIVGGADPGVGIGGWILNGGHR